MADFGISIAEKLIEVIWSEMIKEICSMWGYKSEQEELHNTVTTIKDVLLDAEAKRDLSKVQQGYIAELKDVVYDADDLFDEFRTLVELKQIDGNKGDKIFGKVRRFFSSEKDKLSQAHKMSRRVREIKGQLDGIVDRYTKFGFSVDYKPIIRRREETCSYVNERDIIVGRDEDKKAIIDMLLDPNVSEDFGYVSIVGVGGLGKTTLAQIVFNDERVKTEFAELRVWVCVSDQEGVQFDVKTILCKILDLATKEKHDPDSLSKELVQRQFRNEFEGNKYFLVLDDVWNEHHENWLELQRYLMVGKRGSRIVVTTRSEKTAISIGNQHTRTHTYNLKDMTEENLWLLFEMTAFNKHDEHQNHNDFIEIGKKIVGKCHRNPLAIKVVGSLLYGQNKSKWRSIENSGLAEISEGNDRILPILKLSYHNLAPSLKSCFSYCAIFPKDFEMNKEMLIGLWKAQGYIAPLDGGQSLDDAAEEYFMILMRRCFFQDIKKDRWANIEYVKIHDLMHDVAQEVGKEEICTLTSTESVLGENVRHVNIVSKSCTKVSSCSNKIRTYICSDNNEHLLGNQIEESTALRVLDTPYSGIMSLSHSMGRFILLRYLKLWDCNLETLPESITRLYNLETLILDCENLRKFPMDFSKLVKLRHLDVMDCQKLICMPTGMDRLSNLRILPYFVVGNGNSDDELKVLQVLTKIKGDLYIKIRKTYRSVDMMNDIGGGYLKSMEYLTNVTIEFDDECSCINHEYLLEKLEPPSNVKGLYLSFYNGKTIPWHTISLPHNLSHIMITECPNLEQIPVLSKLPYLKSLRLYSIDSVEYMENGIINNNNDIETIAEFFPALETLIIINLQLKGWWKGDFPGMTLKFPYLSYLEIKSCPNLTSFAPCSSAENLPEHQLPSICALRIVCCPNLASNFVCPTILEDLLLEDINERLQITGGNPQGEFEKLRNIGIYKVDHLKFLPPSNRLTAFKINGDEVESLFERVQSYASSLQILSFSGCKNMRGLPRLDNFIALEELSLKGNEELSICEDDEEPWKSLPQSLRRLTFYDLPKMKSLPKGMQHLTFLQELWLHILTNIEGGLPEWISCLSSLQWLEICWCPSIKSLPNAIKDLTSLKNLYLQDCPDLSRRCKKPNGDDFAKIQQIPRIAIIQDGQRIL